MGDVSTIIAGTVVAAGLTSLNQLLAGQRSMKPVLGGFIVGTGLLIIGLFNTEIPATLALLLVVTSVLINGTSILEKVGRMTP